MTAKDKKDAHLGRPFYLTIASFGKIDLDFSNIKRLLKSQMRQSE